MNEINVIKTPVVGVDQHWVQKRKKNPNKTEASGQQNSPQNSNQCRGDQKERKLVPYFIVF